MLSKFLIALALVATATNLYLNSSSQVSEVEERFTQFITAERRSYFSKEEYKFRLEVFTENVKKIDQMNSNPNDEAEYGVNLFSDRTQEEFEQLLGLKNVQYEPEQSTTETSENLSNLKDANWVGYFGPIKNQGSCGSCWAFAAVAVHEALLNKAGRGAITLSEQQLVDCDKSNYNNGCNGGMYDRAWNVYVRNSGLTTGAAYPYAGKDQACKINGGAYKVSGASSAAGAVSSRI